MSREFHLSDEELLMAIDGELPARQLARAESHLATCWVCRTRKQEVEATIADFIRFQRSGLAERIPPADGRRALLRAQIRELRNGESRPARPGFLGHSFGWVALAAVLLVASLAPAAWHGFVRRSAQPVIVTVPNPAFTPGATVLLSQPNVCRESRANNKIVPAALRARVFAEYGIRTAGAGAYEIDYLITPALGGADDIRNLWPESNKTAIWNAQVKDALEDRLREMVCRGQLDLEVAQREIAANWIEAYKKYFHTDRPLTDTR